MFCSKCNKYSSGNELCFNCYHKELNNLIVTDTNSKYKCIKCTKTIDHPGYCERCYKNNPNISFKELIDKANLKRKCKLCNNEVYECSDYCYEHYNQLFTKPTIDDNNLSTHNNILNNPLLRGKKQLNIKLEYDGSNGFYQHEDEKKYRCSNGLMVRSYGEKLISEFFIRNKIPFEYERETKFIVFKTQNNYFYEKEKALHPDFFIKGPFEFKGRILKNVFIEYWGMDPTNIESKEEYNMLLNYKNTMDYKLDIYRKCEYTLINIWYDEIQDIEDCLKYKLFNYKDKQINF